MSLFRKFVTATLSHGVYVPATSRCIFIYHDISDISTAHHSGHYSTIPELFYKHVELLEKHFNFMPLDQVVSSESSRKRLAAITFDDGFFSVKELAMPYLLNRGIPFSVFVNRTAMRENYLPYMLYPEINRRHTSKVYLDESDVKELYRKGVTIGSHSSSHSVLSECDLDELQAEIGGNKTYLENLLGEHITHFAIPYGKKEHYNEQVVGFCRSVGHKFVYSSNPTYFSGSDISSLPLIPRLGFTDQSAEEVLFIVNRPMVKRVNV
jgi:peptidoglycan/xylan/chitin deacetylase (PgdA/CDA1 family)